MPQYGSRRRLLPPAGQEEYGEVIGEAEEEYEEEEVSAWLWHDTSYSLLDLVWLMCCLLLWENS